MKEKMYRQMFQRMHRPVALLHPLGKDECNPAAVALLMDIPDWRARIREAMHQGQVQGRLLSGGQVALDFTVECLDEHEAIYLVELEPVQIENRYLEMSLTSGSTREIIDGLPDAMALLDKEGCLLDVNQAFEDIFGYSRSECLGLMIDELIVPVNDRVKAKNLFQRVLAEERVQERVERLDRWGRLQWFEAIGYAVTFDGITPGNVVIYRSLDELEEKEKALHEKDVYFKELFHRSLLAMAILDNNEVVLSVNRAFRDLFGYSEEECLLNKINDLIVPDERIEEAKEMQATIGHGLAMGRKTFRVSSEGEWIPVEALGTPVVVDGRRVGMFAMYLDRRAEEVALTVAAEQEAYFKGLFENSPEAVMILDEKDRFMAMNRAFEELFGYNEKNLGKGLHQLLANSDHKRSLQWNEIKRTGGVIREEGQRMTREGKCIDVDLLAFPITRGEKNLGSYVIYRDISERKAWEKRTKKLLDTDDLTGLFNRQYLLKYLEREVDGAGRPLELCFIDLDGFKAVNDTYGHQVGDQLLRAVAGRLKEMSSTTIFFARMGGDEFCGVSLEKGTFFSDVMISTLTAPYGLGRQSLEIGVSMGLAHVPEDVRSAEELLSLADHRMYRQKEKKKTTRRQKERD